MLMMKLIPAVLSSRMCRAGRWILLKLLRPREPGGDNIDVQFVGCRGWRGAHSMGVRDVY